MNTGGKILMTFMFLGGAGFVGWQYLQKQKNKKIAECMMTGNTDISLERMIEVLPQISKTLTGSEAARYVECKNKKL